MNATEVFFSGTPQQLANAVNNLEASYLYSETGKIVFNVVRQRQPDKVRIRIHTPEEIPHADGATMQGSPIAEIEAHTVPTGACITLRHGLYGEEYDQAHTAVALRWWEVLLARLRLEGWRVWTAREQSAQPTEHAEDASKIGAPKPWEVIPDIGWNRKAVELLWAGYPGTAIAHRVSVAHKTLLNRLTDLRKMYGVEIVPFLKERKSG